ncbi:gamma-aminobutyraldehyde dehydrogenase [Rhodococcus sp. 15-1154-1]|nr:aminobutyraldehyde dehydrogenase [Rhodococcus sp. 15-1154-1]OZF07850.1 gamma-aminobutyraldehyde dehydrogenase [Rhodococcus sp. 15-1154-1]
MTRHATPLPFINGKFTVPSGEEVDSLVDPSSLESIAEVPRCSPADVDRAVRSADEAYRKYWRKTTPSQRSSILLKVARALEDRTEEFAQLESRNAGKPISAARGEIASVVDSLQFFAGAARTLEGAVAGEYLPGMTSMLRRDPLGVVGQVAPWNYPLMMAIWKCGPALAAGNAVVLKPAETTPLTTLLLAEVAAEFLPPGVLNVVTGAAATGEALVENPLVKMVSITGSTAAGRRVAELSARGLKHAHLELGGKAPVVVFDDVDIDAAARMIATVSFWNAGQDCTAAARLIIQDSIFDKFVDALTVAASNIEMGATSHEATRLGPVNNIRQYERIQGFLDRCPSHIDKLRSNASAALPGYYVDPTILVGVEQDDEVVQQEIFGPVVTVQSFSSAQQALELANGTDYALASSVWTKDIDRALWFTRELDFGCVWVNHHISVTPEFPHGGGKASGGGKDLSTSVVHEYTEARHVMIGSLQP